MNDPRTILAEQSDTAARMCARFVLLDMPDDARRWARAHQVLDVIELAHLKELQHARHARHAS